MAAPPAVSARATGHDAGPVAVVRHTIIRVANDPGRRFRLLYNFVAYAIAGVFLVIGGGYAFAGSSAVSTGTLRLLLNLERSYRIHGVVMCLLAVGLIRGLPNFSRWTRVVLVLVLFYSAYVALLIMGGWFLRPVTFAAPFWYLFVAVLAGGLLWFAPPLGEDGQMYTGGRGGP